MGLMEKIGEESWQSRKTDEFDGKNRNKSHGKAGKWMDLMEKNAIKVMAKNEKRNA